jgi:hypothetical protein
MLFIFFISTTFGWSFFGYGNSCVFTREDAITCFKKYVDLNHDNVITVEELELAKNKYEGFALKKAEAFLKSPIVRYFVGDINTTTAKVIQDCDYNHDGIFTPDDFRLSTKTCLPNRYGMCLLHKVCETAAEEAFHDTRRPTHGRV